MSNKNSEKPKLTLDEQFARFIRENRGEKIYSAFASEIKVTPSTVFRLEKGKQSVTLRSLGKILNRLGKTVEDVFEK